jgi:hypothetical protein
LDSISLMIGAHDLVGLQSPSPGSGNLYWCSCNMSQESPGGCGATLETLPNGKYHSRCINDSNCENCVGWLAPLSSLINHGGGFIIEIKDSYGQNIAIGN